MSAIKKVMGHFARNAELDEYLKNEIADSGYGGVDILKTPVGTRITLFVTRPGIVIGRRGTGIRSLTENIETKFKIQNPQISVLEIEVPELYPQIMCNRIAHNVRRGTAFRRAALWALNSIMGAGAMGAEISVSGKLRSERAHHEKHRAGIVLKSGETAKRIVREATSDVLLKMGLYGIKVKIAIKDAIPHEIEIKENIEKETDTKPIKKEKPSPETEIKPKQKKPIKKEKPSPETEIKPKQKKPIKKKESNEGSIIAKKKSKSQVGVKIEGERKKPKSSNAKRTKKPDAKVKLDPSVGNKDKKDIKTKTKSVKKLQKKLKTKEK
jgi:small subunit ribosomal protein S3